MIITKLIGGLGNQMFQYAIGRSLAIKLNTNLKLDISSFDDYKLRKYELSNLNINEDFASTKELKQIHNPSLLSKLFQNKYTKVIENQTNKFDSNILSQTGNIYLDGYWQTEKYFNDIREIILQEFTPKNKISGSNEIVLNKIMSTNSVCIHIRRGDYVTNPETNAFHGVCSLDYYQKGIEYIASKISEPVFFVFSDDIEWCKKNIKTKQLLHFATNNSPNSGYKDLTLMSNCKHFIIANSSFSWWGAWLSQYSNKIVVAPQQWFVSEVRNIEAQIIIPEKWTKI